MTLNKKMLAVAAACCLVLGAALAKTAVAHNWLGECDVSFDNPFALEHVYAQARTSFSVPTGLSPSGDMEPCDTSAHQACWNYRHRCAQNYINVEDMNYGHFHLSFENAALTDPATMCFADPGDGYGSGFGKKSGSNCLPVNWGAEPRYLQSHWQDHWIKVWMEDRVSHQPRVFDMSEIYVGGTEPIQFWFKRADGTWYCWRELGPRKRWRIKQWAHDMVEVRIRGVSDGAGPYTIRGFRVQD